MTKSKGFTLVELLVVIGILAVLATATALILNPAELLAQGRDSTRVSDLGTISSAIALYLSDVSSPSLGAQCAVGATAGIGYYHSGGGATAPVVNTFTKRPASPNHNVPDADRLVDGSGWVPVNFGAISAGAPFGALPVDPTNNAESRYRYTCDGTNKKFELNALLESTKYTSATGLNMDENDGGDNTTYYEVGTDLRL